MVTRFANTMSGTNWSWRPARTVSLSQDHKFQGKAMSELTSSWYAASGVGGKDYKQVNVAEEGSRRSRIRSDLRVGIVAGWNKAGLIDR